MDWSIEDCEDCYYLKRGEMLVQEFSHRYSKGYVYRSQNSR